jgi:hypothetical protein
MITTAGVMNITDVPASDQWLYLFMRSNGTSIEFGWKDIDDADFTSTGSRTATCTQNGTGTPALMRVGNQAFVTTSLDCSVHRLDVWGEFVSDANILLAAATDLGYVTNLNTHLPLTNGIGSPYADTSGNARDWTPSGTIGNDTDPAIGATGQPSAKRFGGVPFATLNRGVW